MTLDPTQCEFILKALAAGGEMGKKTRETLDAELSLPNIPLPTMGGEVFWTEEMNISGWRM